METPRNRRSDAFANVSRIVAAAREVFARDGDNATLSQVAAAAGVANATLYRHFPNRRALAAAVYEDIVVNEIKPAIVALGKDAPRAAFIDALAHLEDAMFKQRPLLTSIGDLAELTNQLITRDREQFHDMIMQAQATGDLRPDLTPEDVATFVSMVTTASVAMNQPRPLRRRYLSLMFDALSPADAEPLPPVSTRAARRREQKPVS
ncbi:TetR/AcrR family transcriptional regulator [Mycobacterium sp. PS03-16]|uniref:TetR/AcrR family transcriptional regulator n=1 Tax=Mycobacterium sp. PS03-16 TaxID=2559611 RepID=UPI001073AFBC|nr:TetR/AcrR family transcriptional regulator [Mycobacterium sp. PS03-16]TFV55781.1 TetR/AcrR family transcriptional regulator [Mycobacterium sp. PS03-16]